MRKYKIPQGKHTSYNLHRIWNRFIPRRVREGSTLTFKASINTHPYNITPDPDQDDRHKLIGLPLNLFTKSNLNTAFVTFQSNIKGTWDVTPYFNYDTDFDDGKEIRVKPGQWFEGHIKFTSKNSSEISIKALNQETDMDFTWEDAKAKCTGIILPWHGGKDNNNDGTGGISPIDIDIKMDWKYKY